LISPKPVAGSAANFNSALDQSWLIATATSGWSFNANQFAIDTTGFLNPVGPRAWWNVTQAGNSLQLNFVAIPEPPLSGLGVGVLLPVLGLRKRRAAR
jgi:hypothetical protein